MLKPLLGIEFHLAVRSRGIFEEWRVIDQLYESSSQDSEYIDGIVGWRPSQPHSLRGR